MAPSQKPPPERVPSAATPAPEPPIRILRDIGIPLRDGTRTAAEIWMPDDGRRHPAILVRTPYLKEIGAPTAMVDSRLATARGYVVVLQDVRGRGASEGRFRPFDDEEADGHDSVAWVAAQDWCDGTVVMAGGSYVGATQWLAAVGAPAALRAIAPTLSSDDFAEGWSYTNGVPEHGFLTTWSVAELASVEDRMLDDPLRACVDPAAAELIAPWLDEWLSAGPGGGYWQRRSVAHRRSGVRAPAIVIAGWYDIFLRGSLRSFERSRDPRDRLVLGPWGHTDALSHLVGAANVGLAGQGLGTVFGWILDFYDDVLHGVSPRLPRVLAYLLGTGRWIELDTWPPAGVTEHALALTPGAFAVDPASPVPSLGGRGLLVLVPGWGYGVADQRPLVERPDVHVAATVVVPDELVLAGPITARLAVSADGPPDADRTWTATLCAERPDGALHNLAEGVARAPRSAGAVDVGLGDTFVCLTAGTKLVLLVAGSAFPRWPLPAADGVQHVLEGSTLALTRAVIW